MTKGTGEATAEREGRDGKRSLGNWEVFWLTSTTTLFVLLLGLFFYVIYAFGGAAIGVLGIVFAIYVAAYVAAIQVYLAWRFQKVSNKQQENANEILNRLQLRIDAKYSDFAEIFQGSVEIMRSASLDSKGAIQLALPLYSFGSIHPQTKDGMEAKFRELLCNLIRDGRDVEIMLLDLGGLDSEKSGLLTRLEMIQELEPEEMAVGVDENLKHELEAFIEMLFALEEARRKASDHMVRAKLFWTKYMPLHLVIRHGEESEAVVFVVGAVKQLREKQLSTQQRLRADDVDRLTEGLRLGAGRGSLIFPSFFDRWAADYAKDMLASCEPRLLIELSRSALAKLHNYERACDALTDFSSVLSELGAFEIIEEKPVRVPVYAWSQEGAGINIIVLPSASGLYSRWRGTGGIARTRFSRYSALCRRFSEDFKANVFLVSQAGQAGYGAWSVPECVRELDVVLRQYCDSPEERGRTFVFGICTGGLVALKYLEQQFLASRSRPVAGVLLWDVASKIDFSERRRERVSREYDISFSSIGSSFQVTQGPELAQELGELSSDKEIRFWIGGVDSGDRGLQERGLPWSRISSLAEALEDAGFSVVPYKAEDLGHVPGIDVIKEQDKAADEFMESIACFVGEKRDPP